MSMSQNRNYTLRW